MFGETVSMNRVGYSGRLRRALNVLYVIRKYTKKLPPFAEVGIQFTEIEWLPCVSFLALRSVILVVSYHCIVLCYR